MYVIDKKQEEVVLKNIPIARKYLEVLPKELLGLKPLRKIEFEIVVEIGTMVICKPLYTMASTELKELNVQLQELLDKGFIRPSVSQWEHLFFLLKRMMDP